MFTRLLTLFRLTRPQQPAPAPARSTAVNMDELIRALGGEGL